MRLLVEDPHKKKNLINQIRRAGYHFERARQDGEVSLYKPMTAGGFPRFHVYIKEIETGWEVNLHLDQKRPSYKGTAAHAGEYDGPVVEQEAERLKAFFV